MPSNILTKSNIKWSNLHIAVEERHLIAGLYNPFKVVNNAGSFICDGTKQMRGARLYTPGMFTAPPPASAPFAGVPLAVGDRVDWEIRSGDFVIRGGHPGGNVTACGDGSPPRVPPSVAAPHEGGETDPEVIEQLSADNLRRIGFRDIARWEINGEALVYSTIAGPDILNWADWTPALYAFCEEKTVHYIGKTARSLGERMNNYRHGNGVTNDRVSEAIRGVLIGGGNVSILGFCPIHCLEWGGFKIDLPASLENVLIRHFEGAWHA